MLQKLRTDPRAIFVFTIPVTLAALAWLAGPSWLAFGLWLLAIVTCWSATAALTYSE